jgi:putative ABC transport system permease protein
MGLRSTWIRAKALVRRRQLDADLADEVAFHLSMREEELRRSGLSPEQARRAAAMRFGNVTVFQERTREMWTFPSLESVVQDIRYALRTLRRSPGFTIVAVLALAVGIGANTAIFSLQDAIRARSLPYERADELVQIWGNVQRAQVERRGASLPDFQDWRAQATSFAGMAAFNGGTQTMTGGDEPERIPIEFVSAPYFSLLTTPAARGRVFTEEEDNAGQPAPVVVLSDALWRRRFNADPAAIGQTLTLCCPARQYSIVGVMPPGFAGLTDTAQLWLPFAFSSPPAVLAARNNRGFVVLGRLKPGATVASAQTEMTAISKRLEQAYPDTNEKRGAEVSPLAVELAGPLKPALAALMGAVAFVLLIACANVTNLIIARSESRRREFALRTSLGAGRGRLLRQLMTESCVLTVLGAISGVALARIAMPLLLRYSPVAFPSFIQPALNARAVIFTTLVALACGLLVGIGPALQAWSSDLNGSLKASARSSGGRRSERVRSGLIVAEVSLAVILLIGAGLMIRSVQKLAAVSPGFDPHGILTLNVNIPRMPAADGQTPRAVVEGSVLLDRLRSVPGVTAAALASDLPLDGNSAAVFYTAEGQPAANAQSIPRAYVHFVTPGFFDTLGIPLLAGRTFAPGDVAAPPTAVIVSEAAARRFWTREDAVGKRVKLGALTSNNPWMTIVGVAGDVKYRGLPDNPTQDPDFYFAFNDRPQQVGIAVRASTPPSSLIAPIRSAIRDVSSALPVFSDAPMDDLVAAQTSQSRFTMWLMGVFAAAALMLAIIGIYGVMSYLVTQRTREIGVRMALGAQPGDILRLVVGNGARLIAAGIVVGLTGMIVLFRLISSQFFGVSPIDSSVGVCVAVLAAAALLACCVPALRAARVSPLKALRFD